MRRLYFLLPSAESAHAVVTELVLAHIPEKHIHIIANHSLAMEDLPEATILEKTDLIPALQRGTAIGGATGLLAGLVAVSFPPAGIILAGGAVVLATTLAGAGIGAWASSLIGIGIPNSRLKQFEEAIDRGELLTLVDVPKSRVEEIQALIGKHHATAEIHGTEPTIPPFP